MVTSFEAKITVNLFDNGDVHYVQVDCACGAGCMIKTVREETQQARAAEWLVEHLITARHHLSIEDEEDVPTES